MRRRRFRALRGIGEDVRKVRAEKARLAFARLLVWNTEHPGVLKIDSIQQYQAVLDIKLPDGTVIPRGTKASHWDIQDVIDQLLGRH